MLAGEVVVELRKVTKDYRGLRPLRIDSLEIRQGQSIALLGVDELTAEVLVNLITGAMLPDTGEVWVFGEGTAGMSDVSAWLRTADKIGLLSARAVLMEQLTVEQNLAVPLSLNLDDLPIDVRQQVHRLAVEVGLRADDLQREVRSLTASGKLRVRLGRALALDPRVLLAEHPNAALPSEDLPLFVADLTRIVKRRGLASVVMTADAPFARAAAEEVFAVRPATGEVKRSTGWRRWLT